MTAAQMLEASLPEVKRLKLLKMRNCNIGSKYSQHIFRGLVKNRSLVVVDLASN
jgi:hypothetical protein